MGDRETYLKTQQLADALGVSISSVKRWVDKGAIEATRTMGKHRLVALSDALKFARERNHSTDNLLAFSVRAAVEVIDDRSVDALVDALKFGRAAEASALLKSAFLASCDAVAVADHLVRPTMERIGQLWLVGAWDVYQEHQATQILVGTLVELIRQSAGQVALDRPLALGATPEGDVYTLPTLLGELVLREGGWDVRNLGGNLPFRSLASAIRAYRPKLVFLSASTIVDRVRFLHEYSYFYEAATQVGAGIILGGRALDPEIRSRLVYASFGDRMAHLAEFARQLHPPAGPGPGRDADQSTPMDMTT